MAKRPHSRGMRPFEYTDIIEAVNQPQFKLSLYLTPSNSGKALAYLYSALSVLPYTDYELELIDVALMPEKAIQMGIVLTPSLVYHSSQGDRIISAIEDSALIRKTLGIR